MIASDIDGTLLNYDDPARVPPSFNRALIAELAAVTNTLVIVTNQGGLPFGVMGTRRADGRAFPTPAQFTARVTALAAQLQQAGIRVEALHVSLFHPKASRGAIVRAARMTRYNLRAFGFPVHIYTTARARKPSPFMLTACGATCYYGDDDSDAEAARDIQFVRVNRFYGDQNG